MNKRIQQFLELEDLTPAKLAEILGIQRSGLSHILAGRNKPSFDFIERMLTKFPTLSAEWLITGKGKPYKEQNSIFSQQYVQPQTSSQTIQNQTINQLNEGSQPRENRLFDIQSVNDTPVLTPEKDIDDLPIDAPEETSQQSQTVQQVTMPSHNGTKQVSSPTSSAQTSSPKQTSIRTITRITVFYSDGTYEER